MGNGICHIDSGLRSDAVLSIRLNGSVLVLSTASNHTLQVTELTLRNIRIAASESGIFLLVIRHFYRTAD
jgi:hypothetical protein